MPTTAQLLATLPVPALAYVALTDLVSRRVPNWVCAFIAGFGLATRVASGDVLHALAAATLIFVPLALVWLWKPDAVGFGDVKLLSACALLVPVHMVPFLVLAVCLAGGILALAYLPGRFAKRGPQPIPAAALAAPSSCAARILRAEAWRSRRRGPLPYACAIAAGGVLTLMTG